MKDGDIGRTGNMKDGDIGWTGNMKDGTESMLAYSQ